MTVLKLWLWCLAALSAAPVARGASNTFFVTNLCNFDVLVGMDMDGRNLGFGNKFTLGQAQTGRIPVEADTPLSGNLYIGNSLPASSAEFHLNYGFSDTNFYRINLDKGFNFGIEIVPTDSKCRAVSCRLSLSDCPVASVNEQQACSPMQQESEYLNYLQHVRRACPGVFRHHSRGVLFPCPSSSDYNITFCP